MQNEEQVVEPQIDETPESAQAVDWKAEALKFKAIAERKAKQAEKLPEAPAPDVSQKFTEMEQRVELRMKGYSVEDIRDIEAFAKGANLSLSDAEKHPFVSAAITKRREETQRQEATLDPSSRSVLSANKDLATVLNNPNASPAEKQAAWDKSVEETLSKRTRRA